MASSKTRFTQFVRLFLIPSLVIVALLTAGAAQFLFHLSDLSKLILLAGIAVGSWQLVRDNYRALRNKNFALDYIAILAILTGLATGNFFVAGIIVLMVAGGNSLEIYAQDRARRSLTSLSNRIPHDVVVVDPSGEHQTLPIETVKVGSTVLIRKGEIVPLDGILLSPAAVLDESSLTGEPYPVTRVTGDEVLSGVINTGEALSIRTTVSDEKSTYRQIIQLVEAAQKEKPPFLQLADALSGWFTILTLLIAGGAYWLSGDIGRVLAVLVVATPCPLILAAPVALIGGMNAAARERIIFKRLAALEILARVKAMIFDKTGTLTFGIPELTKIDVLSDQFSEKEILRLAAGLERISLHPFAKAILKAAKDQKLTAATFTAIEEKLGEGLHGDHQGTTYWLKKTADQANRVTLSQGKKPIAHFNFSDVLKADSAQVLHQLQTQGVELFLFTGDTEKRAQEILKTLPKNITVQADCTPAEKRHGIAAIKKTGRLTAMVGDGINDAPALALADVGIVFSHEEHTAASDAADVILLGGTLQGVLQAVKISHRTLYIAKQSMYLGLGLSLTGMVLALFGWLPPIAGAISQEVIDVAVILNALRAAVGGGKDE